MWLNAHVWLKALQRNGVNQSPHRLASQTLLSRGRTGATVCPSHVQRHSEGLTARLTIRMGMVMLVDPRA